MKKWAAMAAGAIILFYLTLAMAPDGPPPDAGHSTEGAGMACREAVEAGTASSSFPLSPTITYSNDTGYAVRGVVENDEDGTSIRRNYDCIVRYDASTGYEVDSVSVWQSH